MFIKAIATSQQKGKLQFGYKEKKSDDVSFEKIILVIEL